jgi:hypothetical protein
VYSQSFKPRFNRSDIKVIKVEKKQPAKQRQHGSMSAPKHEPSRKISAATLAYLAAQGKMNASQIMQSIQSSSTITKESFKRAFWNELSEENFSTVKRLVQDLRPVLI